MNILIRRQFGLGPDFWRDHQLQTSDAMRAGYLAQAAASSRLMVSIAGRRGSGKTRAVRAALRGRDVRLVEPLRLDREKLHLGDIQAAIVRELAPEETVRMAGEARSGQTRRVLGGAATRGGAVVLWIDDAHVLHASTVRALKRLYELRWQGEGPLLGIVLTGLTDRTAGIPEVGLRSDRMVCAGLTSDEAREAIDLALGELVGRSEAAALAADPAARNWLDLGELIDACLVEANARGEERVTKGCVEAVLGGGGAGRAADAPKAQEPAAPADEAVRGVLVKQRAAA